MAFSTQKDFFHVPFMNETVEYDCRKSCVKLKSYDSSIDDRSWTGDETKQSKFLSDLVTCQFPVGMGYGEGDQRNVREAMADDNLITHLGGLTTGNVKEAMAGDNLITHLGGLTTGDSLLECANVHLGEYQKIMNIKTSLEKQLEVSNERLNTAEEENKKIKEILMSKLDSNTSKYFYNKIQKLIAAGKLDKNEEKDMLQIYQKMENMYKTYEILQAENNYLKRLIEKLKSRVTFDNIKVEIEKSTDVSFLQNQVNILRKECLMLREIEDDYLKIKQKSNKPASMGVSEQDAENIKTIIRERNSLRQKCKSLKPLEQQVQDLKKKASEAGKIAGQFSSDLSNQSHYINKMEGDMQNMQKYYEEQNSKACSTENCLKAQIEALKDDLISAKCQAQKAEMLAMEVGCLRNEILKRDWAINDYDCQYRQLMDVVNELQAVKLQCLQDNQTQTCKNETDELAFFTCATLDEIMKELKKKGCINDEFMVAYGLGPAADCAEALKRLKVLEAENAELLQDLEHSKNEKDLLNQKILEGEEKMANMLSKIERLDNEINRNSQEADRIGKELEGTMGLIKDISDVQLKNQQLTNAVSAINSRDDQKIIDDLRRQLEEELAKLKKCEQNNDTLKKEAKERENDLKKLKDLNNKLEADKKKLQAEKQKLQDDNNDLLNTLKNPEGKKKKGNDQNITKMDSSVNDKQVTKDTSDKDQNDLSDKNKNVTNVKDLKLTDDKDLKLTDDKDNIKNNSDKPKQNSVITKNTNENKITPTNESDKDSNENFENNDSIKEYINTKQTVNHKKKAAALPYVGKRDEAAALGDSFVIKTTPKGEAVASRKDFVKKLPTKWDKDKAAALDDFVNKKSESIKFNLYKGKCFDKEIRKVLDEFIQEYGFCLCRLANPHTKLYAICHKLYHCGIETLLFRELAYMHKKIYARAEQLLPGCLLDMILTKHKEEAQNLSTSLMPRKADDGNLDLKLSDTNIMDTDKKCCCCKNELCCNNSEEMLKDKVNKLEKDIEMAREYLNALKNLPIDTGLQSDNGNSIEDENDNLTYRASSPFVVVQQKSSGTNHLKKLKSRFMKHPDIYHI